MKQKDGGCRATNRYGGIFHALPVYTGIWFDHPKREHGDFLNDNDGYGYEIGVDGVVSISIVDGHIIVAYHDGRLTIDKINSSYLYAWTENVRDLEDGFGGSDEHEVFVFEGSGKVIRAGENGIKTIMLDKEFIWSQNPLCIMEDGSKVMYTYEEYREEETKEPYHLI